MTTNGTDDNNDSDVNATTMQTIPTTLSSGENDTTWDMGIYRPASISDRIWLDTNADGIQDTNESNFTEIVKVYLMDENNNSVKDSNGTVVASQDANGSYSFTNLIPGVYHLKFEIGADTYVSPRSYRSI